MKRNEWKIFEVWDLSQKAYYKLFKHKYMHKYGVLVNWWENWHRFCFKNIFLLLSSYNFHLALVIELFCCLCWVDGYFVLCCALHCFVSMTLLIVNVLFLKKCNGICKKARSNYSFHWNSYCLSLTTVDRLGKENIYLEYIMENTLIFLNLISLVLVICHILWMGCY